MMWKPSVKAIWLRAGASWEDGDQAGCSLSENSSRRSAMMIRAAASISAR